MGERLVGSYLGSPARGVDRRVGATSRGVTLKSHLGKRTRQVGAVDRLVRRAATRRTGTSATSEATSAAPAPYAIHGTQSTPMVPTETSALVQYPASASRIVPATNASRLTPRIRTRENATIATSDTASPSTPVVAAVCSRKSCAESETVPGPAMLAAAGGPTAGQATTKLSGPYPSSGRAAIPARAPCQITIRSR